MTKKRTFLLIFILLIVILSGCLNKNDNVNKNDSNVNKNDNNVNKNDNNNQNNGSRYALQLHKDITVTIFWIGEEGTKDNNYISNNQSAWDDNWKDHYGGYDYPYDRNGFYPKNFVPKENPFYFALPYNDLDENGIKKLNGSGSVVFSESSESICKPYCKNKWIKIIKGDRIAYAQWEDVGPFEEDDISYVFGNELPKNEINNNAGLDVSPAVVNYLSLDDIDKVDWQFVNFNDVPNGPWKQIITSSQISWNY